MPNAAVLAFAGRAQSGERVADSDSAPFAEDRDRDRNRNRSPLADVDVQRPAVACAAVSSTLAETADDSGRLEEITVRSYAAKGRAAAALPASDAAVQKKASANAARGKRGYYLDTWREGRSCSSEDD